MAGTFLRHGSNTFLITLAAAILAGSLAGAVHVSGLAVLVGALLFYLTEYGTHRFLFHARPSRFAWLRAKQHRLHYDHHREPSRLDLLFLPVWYVAPNMIVLAAIGALSWPGSAAGLVLGSALALLHYEWVHFIAHMPYIPRTGAGRWMKRYHLKHHFVNEHLWFGVSNPGMDVLYRTFTEASPGARSPTTRVLYPGAGGE